MAGSTHIPDKPLFRVDEIAIICGVSNMTVYRWRHSGKLPAIKGSGSPLKFRREDVVSLLEPEE